jgi:long-chain acyl-CoA synthetase
MTLGITERIRAVVDLDPSKGAIEFKGKWFTFAELKHCMESISEILDIAGQGEATTVATLLRNRPAHIAAVVELISSKRCLASVNAFQSADKITEDVAGLNTAVVIADEDDWANESLLTLVKTRGMVGIALNTGATLKARLITDNITPQGNTYADPLPGTAVLMLTSGTTGPSKRIKLPYNSLERSLLAAIQHYEKEKGTTLTLKSGVSLLSGPLVHIGGMYFTFDALANGRSFCLLEKFEVNEWVRVVSTYKPKVASLPPTALRMVYDAGVPPEALSSLMCLRAGSAPLPLDLQDKFEERYHVPILDVYGATEFAGAIAGWTLPDHKIYSKSKRGSVGRAQPGVELRVVSRETGIEVPFGTEGILEVKTAQAGSSGWIPTTDLAVLDNDGFLFLKGRADDAIVRGGFKVLPREVEKVIEQHPAVKHACVVGIPDERLGAVPQAVIELIDDAPPLTQDELSEFTRSKVVAYQVPTRFIIVDEMPRTPSLKISFHLVKNLLLGKD